MRRSAPFARRQVWKNHTGNQSIEPLRIYEPRSLEEIVAIIREAEGNDVTVRAVGSGHSWSDIALTRGFLVKPTGTARVLDLDADLLRTGVEQSMLVRVEAGIRLRELNPHLDRLGLALPNMGGWDHQTVAG